MTAADFADLCRRNGLVLDEGQVRCFATFVRSLEEWNARVNLISRKDITQLWERHVLHSVAILFQTKLVHGLRVVDIGTGGGFPGIPLKIARPDLRMLLVDSVRKKILAVDAIVAVLKECDERMAGLDALCARAEELASMPGKRNAFDVVVSRAVAPLEELITLAIPLLASHGRLLALKGGALESEIITARTRYPELTYTCRALIVQGAPAFELEGKQLIDVQW